MQEKKVGLALLKFSVDRWVRPHIFVVLVESKFEDIPDFLFIHVRRSQWLRSLAVHINAKLIVIVLSVSLGESCPWQPSTTS